MTFVRSETFRSIGQILAADVLPALYRYASGVNRLAGLASA